MTDDGWVLVHDPDGLLGDTEGKHLEVFRKGGYVEGGIYHNLRIEVRSVPVDYHEWDDDDED